MATKEGFNPAWWRRTRKIIEKDRIQDVLCGAGIRLPHPGVSRLSIRGSILNYLRTTFPAFGETESVLTDWVKITPEQSASLKKNGVRVEGGGIPREPDGKIIPRLTQKDK